MTAFVSTLDELSEIEKKLRSKLKRLFSRSSGSSGSNFKKSQSFHDLSMAPAKKMNKCSLPEELKEDFILLLDDILCCTENAKSINNFMLMSINRCVDFTKVRHGVT